MSLYLGGVTSMDSFLKEFFPKVYRRMLNDKDISNYCKFDSQLLTAFTSSMYVAGLITTLFASSFTEKYGRRLSMLFGGAMFVAGAAIGGAAVNLFMVILARVLLGVGLGFSTLVRT
jgi:MFS transporter, SP family, sugar:H+ symporter